MIKMLIFDIDGVVSDGKRYTDGEQQNLKALQLKDLDAIGLLAESGYKTGCISGENTEFSRQFLRMETLDYIKLGCKNKEAALQECINKYHMKAKEVCYIGDGKYDISALKLAGLAVCPNDAIREVKDIADIVLKSKGGEGCLAECFSILERHKEREQSIADTPKERIVQIENRIAAHQNLVMEILKDREYLANLNRAIEMIVNSYKKAGQLFLCGNGGSAADAQHIAAEFVGRFYLERKALNAEALTTNTSILTALANDYDHTLIFARQLEAKG